MPRKRPAAPPCEDRAAQPDEDLALRWTHPRPLLEKMVDNSHGQAPRQVWSTPRQPVHGHFCAPLSLKKCPKHCSINCLKCAILG